MHDADVSERAAPIEPGPALADALRHRSGAVDPDALAGTWDAVSVLSVHGGDVLFREDDPGDAACATLARRLRAVAGPATNERVLSDAARGGSIAELALLTGSSG